MNQRDSSGLPIRAMVMVLLFLGVIFLLVGLQSLGGSDDDESSASSATVTSTTTATSAAPQEPARPEVRVFNISETPGAAEATATRLRDAEWNVTETGNLTVPDVAATTVYFGETPGEQEAAEEVGRVLEAPVAPRVPELTEQPPGVVVLVTG
ncbi:LytR C-terminal domain-containing protein [Mycobacterium sp. 4D054]|uniref:LytR C-terminal domain-containing protein n=1 Tax=unclassified Mycobacterium TaxID=2642494 RepID=UPI0021B486AD|nr:LytR C-terminal domain-containing protein [Mycobacterium sp. SMC-8]UXA14211.1 LytR C-terminal domain-containing protein [Mycobacterium sp. SMC-8]